MNIYLCSFADSRMKNPFIRLKKQADEMGVFKEVFFYNEKNLDKDFIKKFKKQLVPYSRGFGYWCWKPQIILQSLNKIEEGDILLYMDSGSYLNAQGLKKFWEYIDIVKNSRTGLLAFQTPYPQKDYTKADLFQFFNVYDNTEFIDEKIIEAGHIFIRKCNISIHLIQEWINVFSNDFNLISDAPSKIKNYDSFKDHRHDQSIFSILAKKYNIELIDVTETYSENWETMTKFPLLTKRDRKHKKTRIKKENLYIFYKWLYGVLYK